VYQFWTAPKKLDIIWGHFMAKNRKYDTAFRLQIIKENQEGKSTRYLSKKWGISKSLLGRWIDHHRLSGVEGIQPKRYTYYTQEFKLNVIKFYNDKGLSLRDCCLQFNIPTPSTLSAWLSKYEQFGIDGLREQKGRSKTMKKDKPVSKETVPLTRVEELEKENLYLRAEIDFLKKLDALTQEKQTQQRKKR
jgi:transposase